MHRVSVAMATCNGARFLEAQLDSIAAQDRRPDELVVSDDASEDDTVALLRAFAARAPFPVRIAAQPDRVGVTANFERALEASEGEVVLFADQDDVWYPDKVTRLLAALERGAALAFGNARVVDEEGRPLHYDLWSALGFDARERTRVRSGAALAVFLRHVVAAGTTFAFHAAGRDWLTPFPPVHSSHDAWVAMLCAATGEVALVEEPVIDYRLHGGNEIGIRERGLREQYAQARRQIARRAFADDATFFDAALARLRPQGAPAEVLGALEARAAHARRRDRMSARLPGRLGPVLQEWWSGGYDRFAYGWKSAAQDLLLRGEAGG